MRMTEWLRISLQPCRRRRGGPRGSGARQSPHLFDRSVIKGFLYETFNK